MSYKRVVKFDYYTVCVVNENDAEKSTRRFDFEKWIKKVSDDKLERHDIDVDGLIARIEELEADDTNQVWKLRFIKLRDTNIPFKVKVNETAKPISLENDEYIGEDMLMIYDPLNQIAMIQCNRFSMTKGKLEKFLNYIWNEDGKRIVLLHISQKLSMKELKNKNYRKLELRLANIHAVEEGHSTLRKIINCYNDIGGKSGSIIFSLGRGKQPKEGLNKSEIPIMLDDICENMDIVSSAKLKVRDDDSSSIDLIDLFNNCLCEYITFDFEERATLDFNYASSIMASRYSESKEKILNILR